MGASDYHWNELIKNEHTFCVLVCVCMCLCVCVSFVFEPHLLVASVEQNFPLTTNKQSEAAGAE